MHRRRFLRTSIAGALVALSRRDGRSQGGEAEAAKMERIAVSTWSFHGYFPKTREKDFKWPGKTLDLREFPAMIADRYHVQKLELVNSHFESTSPSYVRDVKAALAKAHSHVVNIPVDYDADWQGKGLCDPDDKQWETEIAERKKWIDIAAELGAESIRPNPGGTTTMTDLARPIEAYRRLGEYGKSKNVKVLIENHGNVAAKAENIVAIVKAAGFPWVGTLPDFGNFPESERYRGLELMFPYAPTVCHARGSKFNAQGQETAFDFPRCVKISRAAGYKGVYSAEVGGSDEPYAAVQNIINELSQQI